MTKMSYIDWIFRNTSNAVNLHKYKHCRNVYHQFLMKMPLLSAWTAFKAHWVTGFFNSCVQFSKCKGVFFPPHFLYSQIFVTVYILVMDSKCNCNCQVYSSSFIATMDSFLVFKNKNRTGILYHNNFRN